ncbi:conserved hypothetical protein [Aquimarina spongiae]|uniref:Lysylphosphatidylglycerol synthase TM region n=1 Tax=Aquimarina spongiae TaxID=570521 RepID=A0A1M6KGA8_9FLAO|nr:conserved hypothetical protein [Aquimarina spongiae]
MGVILFFLLIYNVGWQETFKSIKKTSLWYLLGSLPIIWLGHYLKSLRWRLVSHSYGISLGFYEAFKIFSIGLFLANITPGKVGDFARLYYIKDKLPNRKIGWSSLIMDRIFDLICLVLFSLCALLYYQIQFEIVEKLSNHGSVIWLISITMVIVLLVFVFRDKIRKFTGSWWIAFNAHTLLGYKGIWAFSLTFVSMTLLYGVFNFLAWGMGIHIDQLGLFLGVFVVGILSLLPITVLGLGVREVSLVMIFSLYTLAPEDAIALSVIVFFVQLISLFPGAIWFYLSPVRLHDFRRSQ